MALIARHVAAEIAVENFDSVASAAAVAITLVVEDFDVGHAMKVFVKLK